MRSPRPISSRPAGCRAVIAKAGRVVCAIVLCGLFSGNVAVAATLLETLVAQGERQQQTVRDLEQRLTLAIQKQSVQEQRAAQAAREIERLKSQPQGVARDLALGERLGQAQAQATELAQGEAARRRLMQDLLAARRQLLSTSDRILETDQTGKSGTLLAAQRISWLRLRTAQVEALLGDGNADKARALARSELSADASAQAENLDEPQVLRERADLLRDSADKLRREVDRLQARGEELKRRQRLRERASRVDEDLFAEQSTARRGKSNLGGALGGAETKDTAAGAPPPRQESTGSPPGPFSSPPPSSPPVTTTTTPTTTVPDPSTLDALLRVEGPGDPTQKLQALSRAQGELQALAADLLRRATRLDQRAAELGRKK